VELPPRTLFEAPTVAALAEHILSASGSTLGAAPAIVAVPRTEPLPLSFAQQRLWFLDQLEPGSASYSMPTFVRMEGSLDADALRRALAELASRHEALRTTFTQQGDQPLQVIAPQGELPLDFVDLSALEPEASRSELERHLRAELLRPFDLATGQEKPLGYVEACCLADAILWASGEFPDLDDVNDADAERQQEDGTWTAAVW